MPLPTLANRWSPDQLKFQVWLATPSSDRVPKAQKDLARLLEHDPATLSDWKKIPGWHEAVYELGAAQIVSELVPILHAQVVQAKAGSLPHAQWLFEIAGKWAPRQNIAVAHSIVTEIETVLPPPPQIETIE